MQNQVIPAVGSKDSAKWERLVAYPNIPGCQRPQKGHRSSLTSMSLPQEGQTMEPLV